MIAHSMMPAAKPHRYPGSYAGGGADIFVTKLNSSGSGLGYSTYAGGSLGNDIGAAIAVDSSGHAYVTGYKRAAGYWRVTSKWATKCCSVREKLRRWSR
jgi:hypothetical protein